MITLQVFIIISLCASTTILIVMLRNVHRRWKTGPHVVELVWKGTQPRFRDRQSLAFELGVHLADRPDLKAYVDAVADYAIESLESCKVMHMALCNADATLLRATRFDNIEEYRDALVQLDDDAKQAFLKVDGIMIHGKLPDRDGTDA